MEAYNTVRNLPALIHWCLTFNYSKSGDYLNHLGSDQTISLSYVCFRLCDLIFIDVSDI